jgi:putative ABC transport system substrate-binding protein
MIRRDFLTLLGGAAAAWPVVARAQQQTMPVIGLLAPVSQNEELLGGFRQGLKQAGFVEGENVSIGFVTLVGLSAVIWGRKRSR